MLLNLKTYIINLPNYAFGMVMPGRNGSSTDYRYGFNGMEKDDELKGNNNSYDFGARLMDTRVGRWLTLDMESGRGPQYSPYIFSVNSPILFADPDGNWVEIKTTKYYLDENDNYVKKTWKDIFKRTAKIKTDIIMHNAKLYNYDNKGDVDSQRNAIEQKLLSDYNTSDAISRKKETPGMTEGEKRRNRKVFESTFKFENDDENQVESIKVVNSITEVNFNSLKPDNLFFLVDAPTILQLRPKKDKNSDVYGSAAKGSPLIILSMPSCVGHEFGHVCGLDHATMDGLLYLGKPTHNELYRIEEPDNKVYEKHKALKMAREKEGLIKPKRNDKRHENK